ncbi:MAG: MBG domain-containing protein, partial [Flavobacteriaceae bacterium]
YSITYVSADLTITAKVLTLTADAKSKVYGDADPSLTYQITTGTLVGADALSGTLTRVAGENVGTYAISSTLANTNYSIIYVGADITISAKPITVTGDDHIKVYGDPDPEFTYQLTSGTLESGDTFTGLLTREVTAFSEFPNTYIITQGTLTAGSNYNLTYKHGGIRIIPAAVVSTTQVVTNVTTAGAVLNGTIYEGGDYTNIFFEYGLASDLTGATSTAGSPSLIQPGSGTTPVSLTLTSLSDNTLYYYRITGTNGVGTVNGAIMSFTTLDGTPPAIVSTVPADNTTGVTSSNLQIVFNEDVQKGTGDILIKRTSDNQVVATIPVNGSEVTIDNTAPKATAVEGTITINISPTLTLPSNTDLYIEIPSGAFTDTSGNAFAGISTNTLWNFSTDTVLGIQNNIIKGFTLYPNPVIDVLNIGAQENLKIIQVFNLMGQQVFQKNINSDKATINLNRLPQGTYFVKITTDKATKAVKLIKK